MNMLGLFPVLALGAGLVLNAVMSYEGEAQAQVPRQQVAEAPGNEEIAPDIIAVQIRKQGYSCANPQSAKRDESASRPDLPVCILKCENATYRVRLVGNMADRVERL